MKKVFLTIVIFLAACTKVVQSVDPVIDLGIKPTSTSIQTINQIGNIVVAKFATTPGAKYSVQIIPFGSEEPIRKEGFTATETTTEKSYNLTGLPKRDYDLVFIDVSGKEIKYPLIIK
jgi:hypothetical protein